MRSSAKRSLEELANKSDSEDEDWSEASDRAARRTSRKSKASPRKKSKPAKKRQRRASAVASDNASLSDDDLSILEESEEEEEEEDLDDPNIPRNARGTARRRTTQNRPLYEEPSDEYELLGDDEDEGEDFSPQPRKSAIVKLKIRPEVLQEPQFNPGRRTTRRTRGASEDIYALTNSGRHMETIERGTLSPEAEDTRRDTRRGSRTSKQPVITEEVATTTAEVQGSLEILESDAPQSFAEGDTAVANDGTAEQADVDMTNDPGVVPESENGDVKHDEEDDEDDEGPTTRRRSRPTRNQTDADEAEAEPSDEPRPRRSSRKEPSRSSQRKGQDEESDFEPEEEESNEDESESESAKASGSPRKASQAQDEEESSTVGRRAGLRKRPPRSRAESEVAIELAEELDDLRGGRPRRRMAPDIVYEKPRRSRKNVDYRIIRPDLFLPIEEAENEAVTESPSRRGRGGAGGGWQRTLFPTYGPFGGGGPSAVLAPAGAPAAAGGVDSDSSDDEAVQQPKNAGLAPGGGLAPQAHSGDAAHLQGTPANFGRVKDKQALVDADPLGVDMTVNFDSVGGLQGHIDQLKEMVSLPLLYPEIFQRFHIVPPRGVLFHGPPGTGKTLLARALANSVSSEGRKVTFYMRKGADALSKWVGEAERQLRLLFEEARKTQPSIIFFDEIDGKHGTCIYLEICVLTYLFRAGSCTIEQTGTDPCFNRLNTFGVDGWNGRPRPSYCHWCHQPTRLGRPCSSSSWPFRPRVLLPASQQRRPTCHS